MDLEKLTEISNSVTVADQIIQVLNAICEKLGIVIDWSSKNITTYLLQLMERIVHYRMYKAIVFWIYISHSVHFLLCHHKEIPYCV